MRENRYKVRNPNNRRVIKYQSIITIIIIIIIYFIFYKITVKYLDFDFIINKIYKNRDISVVGVEFKLLIYIIQVAKLLKYFHEH